MKSVLRFLKRTLIAKLNFDLTLKANVLSWFTEQAQEMEEFIEGNRFLICLAIDIKNQLLSPENVIDILKDMDFSDMKSDLIKQFDLRIHSNTGKYFVHSKYSDKLYGKQKYATVMGWSRFFDKIKKNLTIPDRIPDLIDEQLAYDRFFKERSLSLENVKEWVGWKQLTWLTPHEDLVQLIRKKKKVIEIMDVLGLESLESHAASGENDTVIYVEYPDDFSECCYQPTTLCGFWRDGGGLYLSYRRRDGHGRTYSTTGRKFDSRERVINARGYSSGAFGLVAIGQQEGPLKTNRINMVDDGIKRFKQRPKTTK